MPVIRISDQSFSRLQKHAEPFVDTPGSVVQKLLDHYERTPNENNGTVSPDPPPEEVSSYRPDAAPDLTHTNILSAQFNGQRANNWNKLRQVCHQVSFDKLGNFEAVQSATGSSIVRGRKSDKGFHYMPDIGISIRGEGAVRAWGEIFHLAVKLNVPVSVEFEWQNKAAAAFPGKKGRLCWSPQT